MEFVREGEKEANASCVRSAIYLSHGPCRFKVCRDRNCYWRAPRRCDFQNLKLFVRYLVGMGHVSKLAEGIGHMPASDWAGCEETRKQ